MHLRRLEITVAGFVLTVIFLTACYGTTHLRKTKPLVSISIPDGFPEIIFPDDNAFTTERWILGKKLFYDKALSLDSSISCSSCHQPGLAFSDSVPLSFGVKKLSGTQNAPTLANVAYHPYYTRLGGVSTLEKQILVPVQEHNEFNFNIVEIGNRLKANKAYQALSKTAYNRDMDYYVVTRALANFERSLISGQSKYDAYKKTNSRKIMTESEVRGMNLFFSSKTNCSSCHSGFNFTNYNFENNGLYTTYKDIGRMRLTEKEEDLERFKVPTLRNIALTAPYMHDGSIKSLAEVIDHYNTGGKSNPRKNILVRPLNLSDIEKRDLLAFLNTLTDYEFVNNPRLTIED